MATQTIDATLFASSHPDIVKRTSVSGLIFSVAMLLVGVFIFASIFEMSDKSSTLSMALMVLGTAFVLLGVFRLFWKSKEVVYLPTGSVTKERSVFFDLKYLGKLTDMIENEQLNGETEIKSSGSGNVRMDVMISQDNKFAAVQLYQFVHHGCAADDNRRDDVHFRACANRRLDGREARAVNHTGKAGHHGDEHIGQNLHFIHIDARQSRGFLIAADRQNFSS